MSLQCPECGWTFPREDQLRQHRLTHHGIPIETELPAPPPLPAPGAAAAGGGGEPGQGALAAPGWYPSEHRAKLRYFDGREWTQEYRPTPLRTGWVVIAYLCAVLFQIAGLVLGAILLTRKQVGHGIAVLAITIGVIALGVAVSLNNGGDHDGASLGHRGRAWEQCLISHPHHPLRSCRKLDPTRR